MSPYRKNKILYAIFVFCLVTGCTEQRQTLVVRDYVPASQVQIPDLALLRQEAAQGNAQAQFELGRLYESGLGVPKSHKKAMEYWKLAAEQNHALAQYGLGWLYFYGEGVMTDFSEGCYWMRRAGSQGVQKAIEHCNALCTSP